MELTEGIKELLTKTAKALKGSARRMFLARTIQAFEVRRQLIVQKGYTDDELPTAETIATKLNELGYSSKKVAKSQPQKNSPKPMLSSSR